MILNQKGFSLVEVIIASTIMVGMALFMVDMNTNMQKMGKDMEQRMEILQKAREIESLLSSQQACTDSLTGLSMDDSKDISVKLQNRDATGNPDGTFTEKFSVNPSAQDLTKDFNQVALSHLEFENIDLPENGTGKFYINYQFRKSTGSPFSKRYKLLINATATDGKIDTCFSTPEEVVRAITENVCLSLGGFSVNGQCTQIDGASFRPGSIPLEAIAADALLGSLDLSDQGFGNSNSSNGDEPGFNKKKYQCPTYRVGANYNSSKSVCNKICFSTCSGQTISSGKDNRCAVKIFSRKSLGSSECSQDCNGTTYNLPCK